MNSTSPSSSRWQYRVTEVRGQTTEAVQEHLDALNSEGWELINGSTATAYFQGRWTSWQKHPLNYTMWWRKPQEA
jgi:NAD dependent epimerase/dehydratase family enzyme